MIEGLLLDGRNPDDYFNPLIYADRTILRGNEITNHHTTNCVHLSTYYSAPAPADVIIEGNNIHDCGTLPAQNHEHGIYIGAARNAIIRNNRIWSNADRGIQLFTDAQGTQIYGNVISGNGQGVLIAGYNGVAPNNTTVEHNIIAHSKVRHNVESSFDELTTPGTGNVFRENCIYGAEGWYRQPDGSGIQSEQVGFTATANVIADPGFANAAAGDFTVAADERVRGRARRRRRLSRALSWLRPSRNHEHCGCESKQEPEGLAELLGDEEVGDQEAAERSEQTPRQQFHVRVARLLERGDGLHERAEAKEDQGEKEPEADHPELGKVSK